MADTSFGTNDSLTVKLWARKLFQEALKETWFNKFIGEGTDSLIQKMTETAKMAGDRIRVGLRMQLTGAGVQGTGTMEGSEEALTTFSDDLLINYLKHAVRWDASISQQRVAFSLREEATDGLKDWWSDRFDTAFMNQLAGNTGQSDTRYTGNNATIAPSSTRLAPCGPNLDTTEASLSATTTFALQFRDIDRLVAIARTATPLIRPLKVNGEERFVMFIHPYQTYQLRRDTTTNNFMDIAKAALQGAVSAGKNAIYDGALGIYNGVVLHESTRIPVITGSPSSGAAAAYRRSVFCGAQAGVMAFGKKTPDTTELSWREEEFDYGDKIGVKAGSTFGIKKTQFNSVDFGVIAAPGYAPTV
jgi:N4-gp56 family major capsid protein